MEDNIMSLMQGVYSPEESIAPFADQPQLPESTPPDLSFLGSGRMGGDASPIDLGREVQNLVGEASKNSRAPFVRAFDPVPFNRKESGFDPLYATFKDGLYKKLGFTPGYDNDDVYASALGKSGQLWEGVKGIFPLAGMAHNEAWKSEADFWSNLAQGDLKKAFSFTMDEADLQELYLKSQDVFNSHYVPLTMEQREGHFNMGKFAQGIQQFGFTAGTMLQFAEQSLGEMAVAAMAAPETALGSIIAEIGNIARRGTQAVAKIEKVYDLSNAYKKIMKFENQFMDANRAKKVYSYLKDAAKSSPVGSFSNFYRFSKEYNFAASEARFERAQSYGDYIEGAQRDYYEKTGRMMSDADLEKVKEEALTVSNANGVTNIALLYAMNRINMGNILKMGFGLSSRLEKEAMEGIGDEIVKVSKRPGFFNNLFKKGVKKTGEETTEKAAQKTVKPDAFIAAKDVKRFSNEWWLGKGNNLYRWGTDSAFEGVQEVAQGVSSEYWKNYYSDKFKMSKEIQNNWDLMSDVAGNAFGKALDSQMSGEGFDMFLSGFIIGGPSAMINMAAGAVQKRMNPKAFDQRNAYIDKKVAFLNEWARSPLQMLDPKKTTYANQLEIAEGMRKAVKENNPYAFHNLSRKAFQESIMGAYGTGKLGTMFDMMKQAAQDLTDDEFFEAFGIKADQSSRKTAMDYVSQMEQRAEKLVKTIDEAQKKFPNPYNYKQYKIGSNEYKTAQLKQMAWDAMLNQYIFERDANEDIVERYKDILGKNQERLGTMAYPAFFKLTNEEFIKEEQRQLRLEILQFEQAPETPEVRQLLKQKRTEFDQLEKWRTSYSSADVSDERKFEYFAKYINDVQKMNKLPEVSMEDLQDSFAELSDLYKLDQDKRTVLTNLNYLADPENFEGLFNMHYGFLQDEYKKGMQAIDEMMANREKVLELLKDNDFKNKYSEYHQLYMKALHEGKNEFAGAILTAIYEQEFNQNKEEEAKPEEPAKPEDNNPDNLQPPQSGGPGADDDKEDETDSNPEPKDKKYVSAKDLAFAGPYNQAILNLSDLVEKDDVTEDQVNAAYKEIDRLLKMLSPEDRVELVKKHSMDKNALLNTIRTKNNSKDPKRFKTYLTKVFNESSLAEALDIAYSLIDQSADPSLKDELIDHVEAEYLAYVDRALSRLKGNMNTSGMSAIRLGLIENVGKFRKRLTNSIEASQKKAEELRDKTKDFQFDVSYDEDWSNPVHRNILKGSDGRMTPGQEAQIRLMMITKLITPEEGEQAMSMNSRHEASDIINIGVARSYAIKLNKLVHQFLKTKKFDKLGAELKKYRVANGEQYTDETMALDGEDLAVFDLENLDDVLQALRIPKTEILSDEQFKLFDQYTSTIFNIQTDANLNDILSQLDSKQQFLVERGEPVEVEDILTKDILERAAASIKLKLSKDQPFDGFVDDMHQAVKDLAAVTQKEEGKKILDALVEKYGNPNNQSDTRYILSAILSYGLETQHRLNNDTATESELDVQQVRDILDKPEASLSAQDIDQVEKLAKNEIADFIRNTLKAASGVNVTLTYTPDLQEIEQSTLDFLAIRPKDSTDTRSAVDLSQQLEVTDGKISAARALEFIRSSPFATDSEKALAEEFAKLISKDLEIVVDNEDKDGGYYDADTDVVAINLSKLGYKENEPTLPIETVLLHELLHKLITPELKDTNSAYYRSMKSLYMMAKEHPDAKSFYAFQDFLDDDPTRIQEFIVEAFTNPAFQYLLSTIKYGNSKKTLWERFVEIITDLIKKIGGNVDNTVLSEVLSETMNAVGKEDVAPSLYRDIVKATNKPTLLAIRKMVNRKYKNGELIQSLYSTLKKAISAKIKTLDNTEKAKLYRSAKPIEVDGKPYRYILNKTGLVLYKLNRNKGAVVVTDAKTVESVINYLVKKAGSYSKLMSKEVIEDIRHIAGNPGDPTSYAGGGLNSDMTMMEALYSDVMEPGPSLRFNSKAEFEQFVKEYRQKAFRYRSQPIVYSRILAELSDKYGKTAVKNFSALIYKVDSIANVRKIINSGVLSVDSRAGTALEETDPKVDDLFDDIINDRNLKLSQEEYVRKQINDVLAGYFGANISKAVQDQIEQDIIYDMGSPMETEEDYKDFWPPEDTPDLETDNIVIYSTKDSTQVEDPDAVNLLKVPEEESVAAKEPYALRSKPFDLKYDGTPNDNFARYYHKVRSIMNILALKSQNELGGIHITLHKDDANLRWDGSSENEDWKEYMAKNEPGVLGYLSDENGNPLIFNMQGELVGKTDISNLADHKGLNNGDNQIIYFNTTTESSKGNNSLDQESLNKLIAARKLAQEGKPQIADLIKFTQGHFNNPTLIKASDERQNRSDTRNEEFSAQLRQEHVRFELSPQGKALLAIVRSADGAENMYGLYPVNTGYVHINRRESDGSITELSMFDYLLDVLYTFQQMKAADDPNLSDIQEELDYFVRNFWYTSPDFLKVIPRNNYGYSRIGILKNEGDTAVTYFNLVTPGAMPMLNENEAEMKMVKNYLNRRPVNIHKAWLEGSRAFKFPLVIEENGRKKIKFVERDYKTFLFDEVGMKSNLLEIKQQKDLIRYNSTVHFTDPTSLDSTTPVHVSVTEEQVVDNEKAVDDKVKAAVDNTTPDVKPVPIKKRSRFKAPAIDKIYNKSCR